MSAESNGQAPRRIDTIRRGAGFLLGLACLCVLAGLIGLTCVDVVARYAFNSPVNGAYELTELLLATLIFLALPLTTAAGEHIEVELLDGLTLADLTISDNEAGNATVYWDSGDFEISDISIELRGVTAATLTEDHFVFG